MVSCTRPMARHEGGGKTIVESRRSINILDLQRRGYLQSAQCFSLTWTGNGRRMASVYVKTESNSITVYYLSRSHDEDWVNVEQRIAVVWTPCRFGGERAWFVCSGDGTGVRCGRRVVNLYRAGRQFACRECCRLAYTSQRKWADQRALWKAQKIRMKWGGSPNMLEDFPDKPKGMHWRTYERWRRIHNAVEERSTTSLIGFVERMGRRISRRAK
jgi:hypothetical protein